MLTVEIEHVNVDALRAVEASGAGSAVVCPSAATLALIQDKFLQKQHLQKVNAVTR